MKSLPNIMTLTCQCCGHTETFKDAQTAFAEGWDGPPYFTQAVSCNLCPTAFIVLGQCSLHETAHEYWKLHGRPAKFEVPDLD